MKILQQISESAFSKRGHDMPAVGRRLFSRRLTTLVFANFLLVALVGGLSMNSLQAQTFGCSPAMANDIVCENSMPGNPQSEWDTNTLAGDPTILGFATDISVAQGGTIYFKINTAASAYTIDIYRIGYYGGNGARKITSVTPSATLPQTQPACATDATTQLYDCGNWAVSASWQVPANATSGIYIAHLIRTDTGGDSHIIFVVRNNTSHSALLYQASDETWQAYNSYGGASIYGGPDTFNLPGRAYKLSYNRPFVTRGFGAESVTYFFGAEYAMVRFLEANGYDVTYTTGMDAARNGQLITNHSVYLSVGHDEYWSGPKRASVQAAANAGVNLAFFSGNEIFWKTRWENSIDGTSTPYRTLVCYKESLDNPVAAGGGIPDPEDPSTTTATWRDPRFGPPAGDGYQPENALSGTLFTVNGTGVDNAGTLSMEIPYADGQMRFWRNTAVASEAPGSTYTTPAGTLGYEFDTDPDNGFRPAGAFELSTATYVMTVDLLLDYGGTYGGGTAPHHMVMHRAASGALVFSAGSIQWSWGLDSTHDNPFQSPNLAPDPNMQQATINLFADMGVQPATIEPGLSPATQSTDKTPPTSTIGSPSAGLTVYAGSTINISGTASDSGGGVVGGVEVSVNGGQTWHPAIGRGSWTYSWVPTAAGTATILSRAVDDSGNLETPSAGNSLTVSPQICPCDVWSPSNPSAVPTNPDSGDSSSVEVGVKFTSDVAGFVTGIRFYKSAANTGTHIGNVWSNAGTLLGSATFTNETSSGWQQVSFSSPVPVAAGTTYVAAYFAPSGHYAADNWFFETSGADDPPLHFLVNSVSPNGVFSYGSAPVFPTSTYNATNYWVDLVFVPSPVQASPATLTFASQAVGTSSLTQAFTVTNTGTATVNISGITITGYNSTDFTQTNTCGSTLTAGSNCNVQVTFTPTGTGIRSASVTIADDAAGSPQLLGVTGTGIIPQLPPGVCPCSIWNMTDTPVSVDSGDNSAVTVGVKFTASQNGFITGLRFYKSAANIGTHIGSLWTTSGGLLGSVTFTNEGTSGWQQMNFATQVPVTANTTYIASYFAPVGRYSADSQAFALSGVNNPPLQALANSVSPDGIYSYGTLNSFPLSSANAANYWVDVVFLPNPLTLSPNSLTFPNQVVGTNSSQGVTLTNTGTSTVALTGNTFSGTNSSYFTETDNCGGSLTAGNSCTINITFTPTATGSSTVTMTVGNNSQGGPQTVSLSGTATGPIATLSQTALAFPSQVVAASSAAEALILSNTGNAALNITSITITGANSGDFSELNNCGTSLAVGAYCTISVIFTPAAVGPRSATVSIADNTPGSPQTIGLTGTGLATAPPPGACPCSIWGPAATPATQDSGDPSGTEVGVKFTANQNGFITGIRFYKSADNTGTHIGNLWTAGGVNLATITFTNEGASGWQQMSFSNPVPIVANITYVASYYAPVGHYSADNLAFASTGVNNPPLQALANSVSADGVYTYAATSSFPQTSFGSTNYWVDVVYLPNPVALSTPSLAFNSQLLGTSSTAQVLTMSNTGSTTLTLNSIAITGTNSGDYSQTNTCGGSLLAGANCSISVTFTPIATSLRSANLTLTDNAVGSPQLIPITGTGVASLPPPGVCPCNIWGTAAAPTLPDGGDTTAVEIGVKFTSDLTGYITGIRFYKSALNTGTHIGNLWTTAGVLLATATFTGESATGWQQVNFSSPVPITANTTYVASYFAPNGHNSADGGFFAAAVDNPPLHALANSASPDGVYINSAVSAFPTSSSNSTNYWVDVVMATTTVSLSSSSLSLSSPAVGTATAPQVVTLTNTGVAALSFTSLTIIGANSADFAQTNTCGSSVAVGAKCTISVTFTPSQTSAESAGVSLADNAAFSPQTISLTGIVSAPTAGLAPPSLTFANTLVGTPSAVQTITLSNTGNGALNLTSIAITGTNSGDFSQTNTCGTSVAAGANCSISVTFKPTATGTRSASVSITDNASGSPQSVGLTGTGTVPIAGLAPTSLTFINQLLGTSSAAQAITLSNTGTAAMSITSIAITGTNLGDFSQTNTCGTSVAAGANCSISVTFTPTATGARSAAVTITDNASGSPQSAGLTGTGVAPAATLAPTSLAFSSVLVGATSAAQTITLSNGGTGALSLTSIAITGTNLGDFSQTNTCGTSVAAGANCSISVTFTPTATGARSAAVTITDNASGSPQSAPLTGTGTGPVATLSPTSIPFGVVALGTTTAGTAITLSNTGTATLTITSITITGADTTDFTDTTTCGKSLATGANCTITVKFSPKAAGARAAAISISDNQTGSPQTVALSGTGGYTISGTISGAGGDAATVTLTSGSTTVATTIASIAGAYTLTAASGSYTVTPTKTGATFTPASQSVTVSAANITGVNFATATSTAISIDANVSKDATAAATTITTAAFSTTSGNELLLAFVSADNISGTNTTVSSITTTGLTWVLVVRSNGQLGTAEIWRAFATGALTNVTVKATLSQSVLSSITVLSFKNVNTTGTNGSGAIGATKASNAATGAPTASLVTTQNNSWVFGVGNDWDNAIARTVGTSQTMVHQDLATTVQDTYWVQQQNNPTPTLGTTVTINDTAPTTDRYNLAICEILP